MIECLMCGEKLQEDNALVHRCQVNLHPLGVVPEYIWKMKRMGELADAINRYTNALVPIPEEWTREYNKLYNELRDK